MAKFLPFVVEKSTPLHTYQTILSRSKGMNEVTVTSIFWLVLDKGITAIREAASELPDSLNLDKVYEELLNKYSSYRISSEDFTTFRSISTYMDKYAKDKISAELLEYDMEDIMSFLLVMYYINELQNYTPLHLVNLLNGKADDAERNLADYELFSNDGKEYGFETREALAAYIWFHATIMPDPSKAKIKAVYVGTGNANADKVSNRTKSEHKTRFDSPEPTFSDPYGTRDQAPASAPWRVNRHET